MNRRRTRLFGVQELQHLPSVLFHQALYQSHIVVGDCGRQLGHSSRRNARCSRTLHLAFHFGLFLFRGGQVGSNCRCGLRVVLVVHQKVMIALQTLKMKRIGFQRPQEKILRTFETATVAKEVRITRDNVWIRWIFVNRTQKVVIRFYYMSILCAERDGLNPLVGFVQRLVVAATGGLRLLNTTCATLEPLVAGHCTVGKCFLAIWRPAQNLFVLVDCLSDHVTSNAQLGLLLCFDGQKSTFRIGDDVHMLNTFSDLEQIQYIDRFFRVPSRFTTKAIGRFGREVETGHLHKTLKHQPTTTHLLV
mmetsp:Transcript_3733/g.9074  ORF Transcript_3733/g.9074 Transcript_3733/m.9074 type:complete len:305 (+) Transcript_3733:603-1517(+)